MVLNMGTQMLECFGKKQLDRKRGDGNRLLNSKLLLLLLLLS
jgi:hypothetical protein